MPNPPSYLAAFGAQTMPPAVPPQVPLAELRRRAIAGDPVATAQLKALQSLAAGEREQAAPRPATTPGVPESTYRAPPLIVQPNDTQPLTLSGGLNPLNHLSLDAGIDKTRDAIEYNVDRARRFAEENPRLIADGMDTAHEALFGPSAARREQEALVDDPAAVVPPQNPLPQLFPLDGEFGGEAPLPMPPAMASNAPALDAVPPAMGPAGEPLAANLPLIVPPRRPEQPVEPPLMPSRGGAPGPAGQRELLALAGAGGAGQPAPVDAATPPTMTPAAGSGDASDFYRGLLEFGLATMAAGDRPGASALGAIGQGGIAALRGADARKLQRAAAEAAARGEAREERALDIKETEAVTSAELRLAELEQRADDKALDRDMRRELAKDANELRKLIADASAGNTAALRGLQEQQRIDRLDNMAASMYARLVNGARMSSLTGEVSPEQDAEFRDKVARLYPQSSFAAEYGTPPASGGTGGGDVLAQARDAIAAGADAEAVKERLTKLGYDPASL